ncbi:MAG: DUF1588 domain-containing protein [Planctomycetales bacterium]
MKNTLATLGLLAVAAWPLSGKETPQPDVAGYRKTVAPLFKKLCVDCHGEEDPEAKLSLVGLDPNLLGDRDLETWRMINDQLRFREMPPQDEDQPTESERQSLLKWIRAELLKTQEPDAVSEEKLLLPQFGNYVDHHALFDARRPLVTPARPRIWRLRPSIYNAIVPRLGEKITGLSNALNSLGGAEFQDYSAPYFLDEASTQQLFANAKKVAAKMLGPNSRDRALKNLVKDEGPPDENAVQAAIEIAFRKALGRGPTAEEQERFRALYDKSLEIGGYKTAASALLTAVLMQPEFMFRQELGQGEPDEHGRARLAPRELSFALSYALSNAPLAEFIKAAGDNQLADREHVAGAVRRRLQDDSFKYEKNPRVLQFFREYFNYSFATEVFKDQPQGGEHNAGGLVADLEITIREILKKDKQVLRELLTTREYYVGVGYGRKKTEGQLIKRDHKSRKYQTAFSLPLDWKWGAHLQPVSFREDERAGVLTHPAWLAAWSGNFDNHPVQRGKWIRLRLLGGTVPDVPIGVDARVPEKEHVTFRDRLKVATQPAECWRCHRKMDPLGVVFERYDHYGRVQRLDAGQPVNAGGEISRTAFPELHRQVAGPTEMIDLLAKSERVEQVFVRHAFRYFMGRNETLGDANTLQDAQQAYRDSDGSFHELVVSLLSSDSFLLRQIR